MIRSLTYSATRVFLECAYRFRLVYLDRHPIPLSASLFVGGTLHLALSAFYQARIDGTPLTASECESLFSETFRKQTFLGQVPTAQGIAWGDQDPRSMESGAVLLLQAYLNWAEKAGLKPVAVERKLQRHTGGIPLAGRIDAIDRSGIVIDWKTTWHPPEKPETGSDLQPLFYAALLGRPIEFHYHYLSKSAPYEIQWEAQSIGRDAIQWLAGEFLPPVWQAVLSGVYPYADPASRACSPASCAYWKVCKGGALRPGTRLPRW